MTDPRAEYSQQPSSRGRELLAVIVLLLVFALAYMLLHAWLVQVPDHPDPHPLHVIAPSR